MIKYDPERRNGDLDEFITPPLLIQKTVQLAKTLYGLEVPKTILDPCCNLGQWGEYLKPAFPGSEVYGVEIMDVPYNDIYDNQWTNQDFMTWTPDNKYDMIIGNPPYSVTVGGKRKVICNAFVKHSLEMLVDKGLLIFILRKGFNHSVRVWKEILLEQPPMYEYLCLPRPNFFGEHDKRTDGSSGAKWDYSVMLWKKGYVGNTMVVPFFWKNNNE